MLTQHPSTPIDSKPIMEDFMTKMKEKVDGDIVYEKCARFGNAIDGHEAGGASKIIRYIRKVDCLTGNHARLEISWSKGPELVG